MRIILDFNNSQSNNCITCLKSIQNKLFFNKNYCMDEFRNIQRSNPDVKIEVTPNAREFISPIPSNKLRSIDIIIGLNQEEFINMPLAINMQNIHDQILQAEGEFIHIEFRKDKTKQYQHEILFVIINSHNPYSIPALEQKIYTLASNLFSEYKITVTYPEFIMNSDRPSLISHMPWSEFVYAYKQNPLATKPTCFYLIPSIQSILNNENKKLLYQLKTNS